MADRPNILYIFTDQQSGSAMSCAGNHDLHTPAADSLAEGGARFDSAYCTYPLCTPSRASMFTGRMPHELDITENGLPIPERFRQQEMGWLFRNGGYDCGYGGKWHIPETSMPEGHGFAVVSPRDDTHLAQRCIKFLQQKRDQPFLLVASFDNPHNICEWARKQVLPWGDVPDAPTAQCPNLPANYPIPPFEPEILRREWRFNAFVYPTAEYSEEEWRHYRQAYFRLVEKVDAEVGRILEALRELGLEDDTLVVYSSDHGDGHGGHRWSQKHALYDEPTRVPFLLRWPGVIPAGQVVTRLVSSGLDLLPTLCDYAGITAPADLSGLSLRPLLEGREAPWREQVVAETYIGREKPWQGLGRMVVTDRYKYCVYGWGRYREQLFGRAADPGEMVNLAVDERYAGVLAEHRARLMAWIKETGDSFGAHRAHPGRAVVPGYAYEPEEEAPNGA